MSLRKAIPLTFKAQGLSDAIDGTNAFPGAMAQLKDLIPAPSTANVFVCRPASQNVYSFADLTTPTIISALVVIGTRAFGMIKTASPNNHDRPFCYDFATGLAVAITGVTAGNTPTSLPATGDWQPPHMEMVGKRILVTHQGFAGGASPSFGWLDMTSFTLNTLKGNTVSGSKVISSITGDGISDPIFDGVQPGQLVTSANFPAGTRVVSVTNGTTNLAVHGDTDGITGVIINIAPNTTGMAAGMYITGPGIPLNSWILSVDSATQITINNNTTAAAAGVALQVFGGGSITTDTNATATGNIVALQFDGGTPAAPLWCAGNTNTNPLLGVPNWVAQFNGRAWYAVGNTVIYSDVLQPLQVTSAFQGLTLGDTTDVTCLSGLPLSSQVQGGIIQSLMCFKGAATIFQITGDAVFNNLSLNLMNVNVGTQAPNSVCSTPLGLAFVAPDGLRIIGFDAQISDPLGASGQGVSVPFLYAITPSRMVAAFNQNVLRISVKNGNDSQQATQEYWLDFNRKIWTGPHSFPASQIKPYQAATDTATGRGFVLAATGINAKLWTSEVTASLTSLYVENGNQMTWAWQTCLLPDNSQMSMNAIVEAAFGLVIAAAENLSISAIDESGAILDTVYLSGASSEGPIWGSFTWGEATWGRGSGYFRQYKINWGKPLVFKQMSMLVVGDSAAGMAVGNLYLRYQPLGYLLQQSNSAA